MSTHGMLGLIGSGELSDSMAEVHRQLMARLGGPVRPVFIDSPAGFELNVGSIDQKAASYFKRHFDQTLALASYQSPKDPVETIAAAVSAIQGANYIFAGPGSPSYAQRLWRGSPVWDAVVKRWREGAMLVFASAASLVMGVQTIPVYEIYKVGDDPYWLPGLDVLGELDLKAVTVPHWNNKSGDQHDTRFCFMGASRFEALRAQLDTGTTILGIDEYTAILIDAQRHQAEVLGVGGVTLRLDDRGSTYGRGQVFDLDHPDMRARPVLEVADGAPASEAPTGEATGVDADILRVAEATRSALVSGDMNAIRDGLLSLSLIAGAGLEQGVFNRASAAVQAMQVLVPLLTGSPDSANGDEGCGDERDALLEIVVQARGALRSARLWSEADTLRGRLEALNYTIADTPHGTLLGR